MNESGGGSDFAGRLYLPVAENVRPSMHSLHEIRGFRTEVACSSCSLPVKISHTRQWSSWPVIPAQAGIHIKHESLWTAFSGTDRVTDCNTMIFSRLLIRVSNIVSYWRTGTGWEPFASTNIRLDSGPIGDWRGRSPDRHPIATFPASRSPSRNPPGFDSGSAGHRFTRTPVHPPFGFRDSGSSSHTATPSRHRNPPPGVASSALPFGRFATDHPRAWWHESTGIPTVARSDALFTGRLAGRWRTDGEPARSNVHNPPYWHVNRKVHERTG